MTPTPPTPVTTTQSTGLSGPGSPAPSRTWWLFWDSLTNYVAWLATNLTAIFGEIVNYAAGSGTAQAQTADYSPAVTALDSGVLCSWLPANANTAAAPTFSPNGLPAEPIVKAGGAPLVAGDLSTTAIASAIYDASGSQWELQNPQSPAVTAGNLAAASYAAGAGTAQAQTATYTPAIGALVSGLVCFWLPLHANTAAAPTFSPNGLTAQPIVKAGGAPLVAGDLSTTAIACAVYDASGPQWELQNPQAAALTPLVQQAICTSPLTLTTAFQDIPGCTVTLTRAGTHVITGCFDFHGSGVLDANATGLGQLVANGSAQTGYATFQALVLSIAGVGIAQRGTVMQQWSFVASAAGQIVKLQAEKSAGTGTSVADAQSTISALWISP